MISDKKVSVIFVKNDFIKLFCFVCANTDEIRWDITNCVEKNMIIRVSSNQKTATWISYKLCMEIDMIEVAVKFTWKVLRERLKNPLQLNSDPVSKTVFVEFSIQTLTRTYLLMHNVIFISHESNPVPCPVFYQYSVR